MPGTTTIRICVEYDDKVVHTRQISITKGLARGIIALLVEQVDKLADTLLKANTRVPGVD